MSLFTDIIMVLLFVIFMVFIFGGYHKSKYAKREQNERETEKRKEKELE